ncbi:MAG: TIR domain-containing protein, partial [Cyanobacteria bacterium J06649_12]
MAKKHVFLSYCRDNADEVRRFYSELIAAGETVWWDQNILPGQDWKLEIRKAMRDAYAVVLCLSAETADRITTGIYPEVLDAIRAYRTYAPGSVFLIPVRLSQCELPFIEIDDTRTLDRLQAVDLFPDANRGPGLQTLLKALQAAPNHPLTGPSSSTALSTTGQTTLASTTTPRPLKISTSHLPPSVQYFVGRDQELEQLDAAWEDPKTRVISLVAFGGVGKSALVAEWLRKLADDSWRGAQYVLGHSFYSQGSRDDAQVSAEGFIDEALQFLGDPNPEQGSAWDKGERLARLMRRTKTLLILDGLEPMQWGAASVEVGKIKDQGLTALVRELAADNAGLCVITTRQAVADIPAAAKIDLEALSDQAGAALLQALGVKGSQPELEAASRQVKGHGLALRLLGTYLTKVCRGDVRRIGEVDLSRVDKRLGGHAFKLVKQYERWLGDGIELSILRLLGLFDRPAEV